MRQYTYYMTFAVIATVLNIFTQLIIEIIMKTIFPLEAQREFIFFSTSFQVWFIVCLGIGTFSGFVFKFFADKFVVFSSGQQIDAKEMSSQLSMYFFFAIFTTVIFWGVETFFYIVFGGQWHLIGGIIGLAIGYTVKFFLDRSYIFIPNKNENNIPETINK